MTDRLIPGKRSLPRRAPPRLVLCLALAAGAAPVASSAMKVKGGVLTEAARRQTLLQYIAGREDLSPSEKAAWDKAVRLEFGGKAIKDGTDEGVTVAKSVISAAIFYEVPPDKAAKAAYAAYHDTFKWIPPPIAIDYQILTFLGRKPPARSWDLAYDFPRYFNEEMAPDIVAWWEEMLAKNAIPEHDVERVRRVLAGTKAKMRPMLLERLREGDAMERQLATLQADPRSARQDRQELQESLAQLKEELATSFSGVASSGVVVAPQASMYERLAAFSKEMGVKAPPPPVAPPPSTPPPPVTPPARPKDPPPPPPPADKPRPADKPKDAAPAQPRDQAADRPREQAAGPLKKPNPPVTAPLPGEPLMPLFSGWSQELSRVVDGWVGTPYLWGGTTKAGVDCSAFVQNAARAGLGIELPRTARPQANHGVKVQKDQLMKGDLIFMDTLDRGHITHVGIYMGDDKMAHAGCSKGVTYVKFSGKYYQRAYRLAKRVLAH